MNCEDFGRYLDDYENLTAIDKSHMLEHAAMCEKCQAELDFFLSMIATTNSLPKIEPPADFMDKLGERLDAEDKRVVSASKIVYHIRRNWKQYTAAAACLALVTVITANRSMLLDRYVENSDNGVISEETIPAGSTAAPVDEGANTNATPIPVPATAVPSTGAATAPAANTTPAPFGKTNTFAATTAPAAKRQSNTVVPAARQSQASSSAQSTPRNQTPITAPVIAAESVPAVVNVPTAGSASATESVPVVSEQAPTSQSAQEQATSEAPKTESTQTKRTKSKSDDDYGIAHINDPTSSVAYDIRAEEVKASIEASEVKANYSLAEGDEQIAYGRYYTLDRNGNPISSASGIGSIKISSDDEELAMEIIDRYPHDESGNVYTTDSVNLTRMLSKLKSEGVNFTDYTLDDPGEVKFKVIFN
jgi:hypothetical protein